MDHYAPTHDALVRPWRKATVVATAIALVELVLLIVAGVVLLGGALVHHSKTATVKTSAPVHKSTRTATPAQIARLQPIGKPTLTRAQTSVLVLNGNGRAGAASLEANLIQARGYRITRIGNAGREDYSRSVVMYRPGFRAEAARLAHDLGISLFAPLDGLHRSALQSAQLAIVVGVS